MVNGITCSEFDGTPNAAGVVCGNHAIVYTLAGADLTFVYQSGGAVPPPPGIRGVEVQVLDPDGAALRGGADAGEHRRR